MTLHVGTEKSGSYSLQGPKIFLFFIASTPAVGLPSCSVGAVGTAHAQFHTSSYSAEVQNEWSYTATPLCAVMTCRGSSLILLLSSSSSSLISGESWDRNSVFRSVCNGDSVFTARQNWTLCQIISGCKTLASMWWWQTEGTFGAGRPSVGKSPCALPSTGVWCALV